MVGACFNANYFNSIARNDVGIISVDRRLQTSLDGFLRLLADIQLDLREVIDIEMIEVGHEMAAVRESLLENFSI